VLEKKSEIKNSGAPIVSFHEFRLMAMKRVQFETDLDLLRAIEFLHELGTLAYFNDRRSGLCNIVILDVKWLSDVMVSSHSSTKTFVINPLFF